MLGQNPVYSSAQNQNGVNIIVDIMRMLQLFAQVQSCICTTVYKFYVVHVSYMYETSRLHIDRLDCFMYTMNWVLKYSESLEVELVTS